jgi:Protein of unknown function (DUF1631)
MNRNDLLAATRDQFLKDFSKHAPMLVEAGANSLYAKAESAKDGGDERRFLYIRQQLTSYQKEVESAITKSMEKLLHRSFQTAYNNMQQSGIKGIKRDAFSLIDTTAVDADLRLDRMTKTFRDVAGNELRDLNIRIALLFLQDSIKERENPFRPYLLARSLRNATDGIELNSDDCDFLSEEFADALRPEINAIYAELNQLMAANGIGAELQLKIRKTTDATHSPAASTSSPTSTHPGTPPQAHPSDSLPHPGSHLGHHPGQFPGHATGAHQAYQIPSQGYGAQGTQGTQSAQNMPFDPWQQGQMGQHVGHAASPQTPHPQPYLGQDAGQGAGQVPQNMGYPQQEGMPMPMPYAAGQAHLGSAPQFPAQHPFIGAAPGVMPPGAAAPQNVMPPAAQLPQATRQVIEQHVREEVSRQRVERFINWVQRPDQPIPTVQAPNIDDVFAAHMAEASAALAAQSAQSPQYVGQHSDSAMMGIPGLPGVSQQHGATPYFSGAGAIAGHQPVAPSAPEGPGASPFGPGGSPFGDDGMVLESPEPFIDPSGATSYSGIPNQTGFGAPHPGHPGHQANPAFHPGAAGGDYSGGANAGYDSSQGASNQSAPSSAPTNWMAKVQAIGSTFRRMFSRGPVAAMGDAGGGFPEGMDDDGPPTQVLAGGFARTSALGRPQLPTVPQRAISTRLMSSVRGMIVDAPSADMLMSGETEGSVRNLIMERREELTASTDDVTEQISIDVVAMLFEFILRDTDVPAETRAQLGRLQFVVLKVALRDVEFFTHPSHPARMLVNRVGSLSHALKQVDPLGVGLNQEVCRIVEVILADEHAEAELFSDMIDELDHYVAGQLRSTKEEIELAAQAMESVESRTLRFARITSAIADALSFLKVDPNLHRLLVDTWANVVEIVERNDPADAKRFRELVPDLVWTVAPKVDKSDRNVFIAMLPRILGVLREGMNLLNWDQERQDAELAWLIENHTFALRAAVPMNAVVPPLSLIREKFAPFVDHATTDEAFPESSAGDAERRVNALLVEHASREFGAKIEVIDDMLAEDQDFIDLTALEESQAAEAVSKAEKIAADETAAQVLAQLRAGVRVMLQLVGDASPARLTWVSPTATTLLLAFDDDDKPFVLTVRMFLRMLKLERATFIETEPLFERRAEVTGVRR